MRWRDEDLYLNLLREFDPWVVFQDLAFEACYKVGLESFRAGSSLLEASALMDVVGASPMKDS